MNSSASPVVELIFTKCTLVYGRDFLNRWEGLDLADVKADWAHELGNLLDNPQAIRHALTHLPIDKPPTVLQFRHLCINHPLPPARALPAPRATPEARAAVRSLLQQARDRITRGAA